MDLLIYVPNQVKAPVPVFLGLNFAGNQTIHTDPGILSCPKNAGNERGMRVRRWPVEEILARGYGVATAWYGDIQPDLPDTFKEGVHQLFFKPGQRKPAPGEWGAIGAWAWGLSSAMDYLEIGRASGRERGGQYVLSSGVAVSLKKKNKTQN